MKKLKKPLKAITVRFSDYEYDKLKKLAEQSGRKLANQVWLIVRDKLNERIAL